MEKLDQESSIQETDLLLSVWTKPKQTLDFILHINPTKYVKTLLILGGVTSSLNRISAGNNVGTFTLTTVIVIAIIGGGLFGWISFYIYSSLLSWTGKWLKGKADTEKFLTVVAWSNIPLICTIILWVLKLIAFGDSLYAINADTLNKTEAILYYIFGTLEFILTIWSLIILVKGTALIQKFTIQKAFLNVVLPIVVIAIPIVLIFSIIYLTKN